MRDPLLLRLRPDAAFEKAAHAGGPRLRLGEKRISLATAGPGVLAALALLAEAGGRRRQLFEAVAATEPDADEVLDNLLAQLTRARLLHRVLVSASGEPLATAIPTGTHFQDTAATHPSSRSAADPRYTLSRFALLRRAGRDQVLESPLSATRIVLHDGRCAGWLHALSPGRSWQELADLDAGPCPPVARGFVELLCDAGLLSAVDDGGATAEDADPTLAPWEMHDLWMHARSRAGRHVRPYGRTHRFAGTFPPLPAVKPPMEGETIPLFRPDLAARAARDLPFTEVLESRRTIRHHGEAPLTDRQLGELLYRVARTRGVRETPWGEVSERPYPAGGGAHELELYPLIQRCRGLEPGLYHYAGAEHQLVRLSEPNVHTEELLSQAVRATTLDWQPQVLIVIAARFQRVAWTYQSIAYALTLKHVGVLVQTLYLVATAMGLAPCALGGGSADLFARAAGTDYYAESSVGEFLIGSRPPED